MPLLIKQSKLKPINIDLVIPSAQIKSGLLLASLNTEGETIINEFNTTRDHTETMLKSFGANIDIVKNNDKKLIKVLGKRIKI